MSIGSGRLDVTTMGDLVGACVGVGTLGISKPDADICAEAPWAARRRGTAPDRNQVRSGAPDLRVHPVGRRVLRDDLPRPRREEGRANAVQSRLQGQVRVRAGLAADGRRLMRGFACRDVPDTPVQPVQATRAGMPDVPVYRSYRPACVRVRAREHSGTRHSSCVLLAGTDGTGGTGGLERQVPCTGSTDRPERGSANADWQRRARSAESLSTSFPGRQRAQGGSRQPEPAADPFTGSAALGRLPETWRESKVRGEGRRSAPGRFACRGPNWRGGGRR